MKKIALLISSLTILFWFTNCATYIRGDLTSKRLPVSPADLKFSATDGEKRMGILQKNGKTYNVTAAYSVWGVGESLGIYTSLFSLGLVPFYSTNNGDVVFSVRQDGKEILSGRLDNRFHTIYGWLAVLNANESDQEDLIEVNEAYSMQEQVIEELDRRLARYLNLKL